ncbi:MAG TPA: hypothetical protein DCZ03_10135 [Gammaproteobacteria bacterium]|nr:hypothetical protein [Gammaproteobacteria bacterium]
MSPPVSESPKISEQTTQPELGCLVLVVNASKTDERVFSEFLHAEGHQVCSAQGMEQALRVYFQLKPDIVLVDLSTNVREGERIVRAVKEQDEYQFVPVLLISLQREDALLVKSMPFGADDFISGSFDADVLHSKMNAMLRLRAQFREQLNRHRELSHRHQNIIREHDRAERIFTRMLHPSVFNLPNVRHLLSPMGTFSGDFLLAAPTPFGGQIAMVADFTGHGLSAAIGALPTSNIFYGMARKGFSVRDIVVEINERLYKILPPEMFMAAGVISYEPQRSLVSVWNGGIPEIWLKANGSGLKATFASRSLPLGILPADQFDPQIERMEVETQDRIYIFSDGIIEAENLNSERFGLHTLKTIVEEAHTTQGLFNEIILALDTFRDGQEQTDDLTLMEFACDLDPVPSMGKVTASEANKPLSDWQTSLVLNGPTLRSYDPVPNILQQLVEIQGLSVHRERLYTVFSELYTNALEHGILGLDSSMKVNDEGFQAYIELREQKLEQLVNGQIEIMITHRAHSNGGRIHLEILDTGPGFDHTAPLPLLRNNKILFRRGIPLVKAICSELTYLGRGNHVVACYDWHQV